MTPKFFYFDLGNVVFHFSHRRAAEQMAEVAGIDADRVWQVVFDGGLQRRVELGEIDARQMYELFCQETDTRPEFEALERAGSDIFDFNKPILPVIGQLDAAGHRLGILTNTCESHWNFLTSQRNGILPEAFDIFIRSYEVGVRKPDAKIYQVAADRAEVAPDEIFFVDDLKDNVEAARAAGFDAIQFTDTTALIRELVARQVPFNC